MSWDASSSLTAVLGIPLIFVPHGGPERNYPFLSSGTHSLKNSGFSDPKRCLQQLSILVCSFLRHTRIITHTIYIFIWFIAELMVTIERIPLCARKLLFSEFPFGLGAFFLHRDELIITVPGPPGPHRSIS
jgi:hypothetical protein